MNDTTPCPARGARPRHRPDRPRSPRRGFTLVELLVVIAIIGVLASLIMVAAMSALDSAKQTVIKAEIDQLDAAMKDFKNKYGMYPPSDLFFNGNANSNPALISFLRQAFPRYQPLATNPVTGNTNLYSDWTVLGLPTASSGPSISTTVPTMYRADVSLVFWLSGFSADPTSPFCGGGPRTPFFNFDNSRLVNLSDPNRFGQPLSGNPTGFPTAGYNPPTFSGNPSVTYTMTLAENQKIGNFGYVPLYGNGTPYCYFDSGTGYGTVSGASFGIRRPYLCTNANGINPGIAAPYIQDLTYPLVAGRDPTGTAAAGLYQFCNPETFQIVSAGQDGMYGFSCSKTAVSRINVAYHNGTDSDVRLYPTGYGYDASGANNDDVTNFSNKGRLSDAIP